MARRLPKLVNKEDNQMISTLYFDDRSPSVSRWNWKLLSPLYAEIVVDLQARDLKDRLFTYKVPEFLLDEVFVGAQVLVPFGHQETVGGYVVSLKGECDANFKIKEIAEVLEPDPLFDKDYIDFLGWLAFKSCARLSDVVQAAIPASLAPRIKRVARIKDKLKQDEVEKMKAALSEKNPNAATVLNVLGASSAKGVSVTTLRQRFGRVARKGQSQFFQALTFLKHEGLIEVVAETSAKTGPKTVLTVVRGAEEPKTARQKEITALLERHNGTMNLADLLKGARTTYSTVHKLEAEGVIQLQETEVFRNPMDGYTSAKRTVPPKPSLTRAQEQVVNTLSEQLRTTLTRQVKPDDQPEPPWLLHGVTGSGKTEVYLRLIEEALEAKRTALLLVPEISLTPQLASRLKDRFGDRVSIWHSAISPGERYDTWRRLRSGDVSVLLGARSAILAHLPDLGLIILDEEHDSSYKQSTPSPRYNAKEVAIEKARRTGALVLFGSATPDVATYHRASQAGRILELPERVHSQAMPEVQIVDMRQQLSLGNRSILSTALSQAIEKRLDVGEQIILLMNRRGYASHVFCRACGYVIRCNNCSVSLVYHKNARTAHIMAGRVRPEGSIEGYLSCHHCGYERHNIVKCPSCESPFIKEYGLGTQQVEETVRNKFPGARTLRLDSDVTQRKGAYREIFEDFAAGEADVLIGTQMVAKGLDIANVTLVGVLVADASLNMPDYRSMERGFQLLCQVSGRAGRGLKPGKVILQTYNPELKVFKYARHHDFANFFKTELEAREAFSYPPYSRIIRVVLQGPDPQEVESGLEKLAEELSVFLEDKASEPALQILGPSPCVIEKVKNRFRFHLLMKVKDDETVMDAILQFLRNKKVPKELSLAVDVDALDLL